MHNGSLNNNYAKLYNTFISSIHSKMEYYLIEFQI